MNNVIDMSGYVSLGLESLFYLTLVIFGLYTLSFMYHWLNFGVSRTMSLLAVIIHLAISLPLIGIAYITLSYVI